MQDGDHPALLQADRGGGAWLWHSEALIDLTPLEGGARTFGWHTPAGTPLQVGADREGRYVVTVRAPEGYAAIEPFAVELAVGRTRDVTVDLARTF